MSLKIGHWNTSVLVVFSSVSFELSLFVDGPCLSLSSFFCRFPQVPLGLWVRFGEGRGHQGTSWVNPRVSYVAMDYAGSISDVV